MTFSKLLGLIFCNILWSGTYSVGKTLMTKFNPLEVSFLRSLFAVLPLLIYCAWGGRRSLFARWWRDVGRVDLRIVAVGLLTFFLSPLCQMNGLQRSRAIDGSLIVALEPVFTVVAAVFVLREPLRKLQSLGLLMALLGVGVLSEVTIEKLGAFTDARLIGNAIIVLSLVSEAGYSILSKPAFDRRPPVLFITLALLAGLAALFIHNVSVDGWTRLSGVTVLVQAGRWTDWAAFLYLGLGCTAFGYLYWLLVLQDTPVGPMVLTLYVQPVLGILLGHYWLGESLSKSTFIGSALIFIAVWLGSRPAASTHSKISSHQVAAP